MRYTPFRYLERYGLRLQRLAIDGGFSCPNRDGALGSGGCSFCDNRAFHPGYTAGKSIREQIEAGIVFHRKRGRYADAYLAYFQAYSNTYAPLATLMARYEEALSHPQVRGLVIGTRPDCIQTEILEYLSAICQRGYIVEVEYGIESVWDPTLLRVNRGHDYACTQRAIAMTAEAGIPVGGHIMLGLPGETRAMICQEAEMLNTLPLSFLKLHQLQILKGTAIAAEFRDHPADFLRLGPDEYVELLADFLERLRPDIAIGRIVSTVPPAFIDAPWGLIKQDELLRRLEAVLAGRGTCQGAKIGPCGRKTAIR